MAENASFKKDRTVEDIIASINNECRWCSGKDCSVCVWKHK